MERLKILCLCLLSSVVFLNCSDSGGGGSGENTEERANSAGKTEDGHDVLVFQEGSLDNVLTKIDTIAMTDTSFSGTLLFKNMKSSEIPTVGDIIASAITENAPYGFLYKVLGVHTKDGITAVVVRDASLEEAIEDVDFESETIIEFDEEGEPIRALKKL